MEAKLVSGHAKAKEKVHKGRKATHMRIERAENGVIVHTEHEKPEMSRNQKMGMGEAYEPPEAHTFNNHEDMMDHIKEKFGDVLPETDDAENDKKMNEHGKPKKSAAAADGASKGPVTDEYEDEDDESD